MFQEGRRRKGFLYRASYYWRSRRFQIWRIVIANDWLAVSQNQASLWRIRSARCRDSRPHSSSDNDSNPGTVSTLQRSCSSSNSGTKLSYVSILKQMPRRQIFCIASCLRACSTAHVLLFLPQYSVFRIICSPKLLTFNFPRDRFVIRLCFVNCFRLFRNEFSLHFFSFLD